LQVDTAYGTVGTVGSTERAGRGRSAQGRARWLALEPHPVLAFLYEPPERPAAGGTAVLFCPAFGWEEMCAYRGRRAWAQALAQTGHPAATFSLPGSADSGGSPRDPGLLDAWTVSVSEAAEWLAAATGAERLAAIGIGLGGMLACRALAGGAPIDELILWGVPASGRRWLRELDAYARLIRSRHPEDYRTSADPEGDREYTGFLLSAETARELERLDLTELEVPAGRDRRVLLLGRDRTPPDRALREHFERAGASVTVQATDDYAALMLHPQEALPPAATIAKTLAWLAQDGPARRPPAGAPATMLALERRSIELPWEGGAVRETPVRFEGPQGAMFGVLSQSAERESAPAPVGVVWIGAGALRHTGPNRAWVESARRWATRGVPTVRVDLLGLGDSEGPDRPASNDELYAPGRLRETLTVLDQLNAEGVAERFVLGGLCSGAYWSLHAALADERVAGLLLLNLYAFFWSDPLVAERLTHGSMSALRGRGWRRLARRGVTFEQMRAVASNLRPARLRAGAGRPAERAQSADVERALDRLRDLDVQTLLLFARGEALPDQLRRQGVLDRLERWPNLTVETFPSHNHMFRALWLQRHVARSLDAALDRVLDAAGRPVGR
jgi:hypothetical protein